MVSAAATVRFWRLANPPTRRLAGWAPWWVLLETTGRRSGLLRRTPLASGPADETGMWLIAVHGRSAGWLVNLEADPTVRVKHRGRWRTARAEVRPWDPAVVAGFNAYARSGPRALAREPLLVRLTYLDG